MEKQMKKFKGLKRFSYSSKVVEDEIYYFRSVNQAEHCLWLEEVSLRVWIGWGLFLCRKLIVPQKEASPLLDKKINELEVKLADIEDGDDDMEDMDDDDEAPQTPSMPQMQTPLANDMDALPYTPQVSIQPQPKGNTTPCCHDERQTVF